MAIHMYATPSSATAPIDSGNENFQYPAACQASGHTNLSAPVGRPQPPTLPGFRTAGTIETAPLGNGGGSWGNLPGERPTRPPAKNALLTESRPSSSLDVEAAGNRDDPKLTGNDAATHGRTKDGPAVQSVLVGQNTKQDGTCLMFRIPTNKHALYCRFILCPAWQRRRPCAQGHRGCLPLPRQRERRSRSGKDSTLGWWPRGPRSREIAPAAPALRPPHRRGEIGVAYSLASSRVLEVFVAAVHRCGR